MFTSIFLYYVFKRVYFKGDQRSGPVFTVINGDVYLIALPVYRHIGKTPKGYQGDDTFYTIVSKHEEWLEIKEREL